MWVGVGGSAAESYTDPEVTGKWIIHHIAYKLLGVGETGGHPAREGPCCIAAQ